MFSKLPTSFYERDDVVTIARELLGKVLVTKINNTVTAGIIVETEAYRGESDLACHACVYGKTERTKIMFGKPGHAYIYLCYGIHHLFNVVTNKEGFADAVLIRAIEPIAGIDTMLLRRNKTVLNRSVGGGPGIVSSALGITTKLYGTNLQESTIWLEDRETYFEDSSIIASPRVGVNYAGNDAHLPWRFRVKGNAYTSPAK
ncbi:MAG: DNA-3-methyladenine glycosylase [Balneolaceae bacterium]